MMKQKLKLRDLENEEFDNIKEEDLKEEVKFEINKDLFKATFTCHGKKTILLNKKLSFNGIEFNYSVWHCKICKKEYLDSEQGRRLEKFWIIKRSLEENLITIERSMNYDG